MSKTFQVAVLVGSLRRDSITRKVASALMAGAPASLKCKFVEIGDLPLYNQDFDDAPPAAWERFRAELSGTDAVLFLTPEYNRSVPGCLKNAIDVGSRPQGHSVFDAKPAGVVSVTPYKLGAFGANHALRQALVFLNMPVMQQPEAYIGGAAELFARDGSLQDPETRKLFATFMQAFARWVATIGGASGVDFDEFMRRRAAAAAAYVNGDSSALNDIVTRGGAATFFPPSGGFVSGADEVFKRYNADSKSFEPAGTSRLEVLQSGAGADIAFWSGIQLAEVKFQGKDARASMKLRITEIFRRSGAEWQLVHRHADAAADAAPPKSKD